MYHGRKGVKVKKRRASTLFGVVCKNASEEMYELLLKRCIRSIAEYHPNDKIVIVDSDSEDKSYFEKVKKESKSVVIEDIKNKNYEAGAFCHILEKYPDEHMYVFMQDSMHLTDNLEEVYPKNGVTVFGPRVSGHSQVFIYENKTLKELGKPSRYVRCVPGCVFMIDGASSKKLRLGDWKKVLPVCRKSSAAHLPPSSSVEESLLFVKEGKPWRNNPVEPTSELWEGRIWGAIFAEARDLYGIKIRYLNQFLTPSKRNHWKSSQGSRSSGRAYINKTLKPWPHRA